MTDYGAAMTITLPICTVSEANRRDHWTTRNRRARRQRSDTRLVLATQDLPPLPVVVTLTRIAPRRLDTDNLAAALKAVRDGVADALGCDDSPEAAVTWVYGQERGGVREHGVRVEIRGGE